MSFGAIEKLVSLVEADTGADNVCWDDAESVGWCEAGELPMTFGDVRRARQELETLKQHKGHLKVDPSGRLVVS